MVVFPAPDSPVGQNHQKNELFCHLLLQVWLQDLRTCKPNSTATETTSGSDHLATLASANMVSLVHNIGRSMQVLRTKEKRCVNDKKQACAEEVVRLDVHLFLSVKVMIRDKGVIH